MVLYYIFSYVANVIFFYKMQMILEEIYFVDLYFLKTNYLILLSENFLLFFDSFN